MKRLRISVLRPCSHAKTADMFYVSAATGVMADPWIAASALVSVCRLLIGRPIPITSCIRHSI